MTILRNKIARMYAYVPAALTALVFSVTMTSTVAAQTAAVVGLPAPGVASTSVQHPMQYVPEPSSSAKAPAEELAYAAAPQPLTPPAAPKLASPAAPLALPQDSSSSSGSVSNSPPPSSGSSDAWVIWFILALIIIAAGGVVVYEEEDDTTTVSLTCYEGPDSGLDCTDDAECDGYTCDARPSAPSH